jgi:hypothetical protein
MIRPADVKAGAAPGRVPWPRYRLTPGSAPLARCVGAFRRGCVMLTTAVLCDTCWTDVESVDPKQRRHVGGRYRVVRPVEWTPEAVELPIRGEVE